MSIGHDAIVAKGWFGAHKWLLARRVSQLGILALFLLGPLAGVWIVKGNLSFSYTLGVLPLTDPYILLQSLLTRHLPEQRPFSAPPSCWRSTCSSAAACSAPGSAR